MLITLESHDVENECSVLNRLVTRTTIEQYGIYSKQEMTNMLSHIPSGIRYRLIYVHRGSCTLRSVDLPL